MSPGEPWRTKLDCDIVYVVTLQKRHSMRMWTKWPRWSRCIPSVNASWMLHCCLVIGLITLLIACSVFLSFLHSHHFLPAPLLNHLPHSFFISWCLLIFIFVEWEWTFIGPWCSSGFFYWLTLLSSVTVHDNRSPSGGFLSHPNLQTYASPPTAAPPTPPRSALMGWGPVHITPTSQRWARPSCTPAHRPSLLSPKYLRSPCKPPGPTHSLTRTRLPPPLNLSPPPRASLWPLASPTAPGWGATLPLPFPPSFLSLSPRCLRCPHSAATTSTLTTTPNLSPSRRWLPTPPPEGALSQPPKAPQCTRPRTARLARPARHHRPALPWVACPGGRASTPSRTASSAHHASTAGKCKVWWRRQVGPRKWNLMIWLNQIEFLTLIHVIIYSAECVYAIHPYRSGE